MTHPIDDRCGTGAGYKAHQRRGEDPCQPCRDGATAEDRLRSERTAKPIEHGTMSGYRKCRKRPEGACEYCREANAIQSTMYRRLAPIVGMLSDADAAWMERGVCRDMDADLFFPDVGVNPDPARAICATCPVESDCLEYALANNERHGVWGGKSARERRVIPRQRKARQQLTTTTETT